MYIVIIILFLLTIVFYITPFQEVLHYQQNSNIQNLHIIEYLTQYKRRVEKNYGTIPERLGTSMYNVTGEISENCAEMKYHCPLIENISCNFNLTLYPDQISTHIDCFGLKTGETKNDGRKLSNATDGGLQQKHLYQDLGAGNFLIDSDNNLIPNYKKIVLDSLYFSDSIAKKIISELQYAGLDSYFNRVQAALNFVQFIPYGIPDFDTSSFFYGGLSLPPESFVLNYSDCDSKSVFFASILCQMIDKKNILLVSCRVADNNTPLENHMMVAVAGLGIDTGESVEHNGLSFIILETTSPCVIGDWHWDEFYFDEYHTL